MGRGDKVSITYVLSQHVLLGISSLFSVSYLDFSSAPYHYSLPSYLKYRHINEFPEEERE